MDKTIFVGEKGTFIDSLLSLPVKLIELKLILFYLMKQNSAKNNFPIKFKSSYFWYLTNSKNKKNANTILKRAVENLSKINIETNQSLFNPTFDRRFVKVFEYKSTGDITLDLDISILGLLDDRLLEVFQKDNNSQILLLDKLGALKLIIFLLFHPSANKSIQTIKLDTLKEIMLAGSQSKSYERFANFHDRFLKPAVRSINNNLNFFMDYERVTRWNKTYEVCFKINSPKHYPPKAQKKEYSDSDKLNKRITHNYNDTVYDILKGIGVDESYLINTPETDSNLLRNFSFLDKLLISAFFIYSNCYSDQAYIDQNTLRFICSYEITTEVLKRFIFNRTLIFTTENNFTLGDQRLLLNTNSFTEIKENLLLTEDQEVSVLDLAELRDFIISSRLEYSYLLLEHYKSKYKFSYEETPKLSSTLKKLLKKYTLDQINCIFHTDCKNIAQKVRNVTMKPFVKTKLFRKQLSRYLDVSEQINFIIGNREQPNVLPRLILEEHYELAKGLSPGFFNTLSVDDAIASLIKLYSINLEI